MFSFFKKKKIVPHIKLSGVIGNVGKFKQGIDFSGQEEIIAKAFALKKAPCVAITINSPGGSVSATNKIYNLINDFKKDTKIPIYFHTSSMLASGGYWLSLSGDKIFASFIISDLYFTSCFGRFGIWIVTGTRALDV